MASLKQQLLGLLHAGLPKNFPVCFIVSTGRTGTKFFESFFERVVDDVHCLHEPAPDLFDLGVGLYRGKFNEAECVAKLRSTRLPMLLQAKSAGKRMYVESNPNASLLLPQIKQAFPNYRILWITRDITSYLPSAYNKSPDDSGTIFFYADNDHRKRLNAKDIKSDAWNGQWDGLSRAERVAWWWQKCNSLLLEQTKDDPACMRIRFEDMFGPTTGRGEVERLLSFFGADGRIVVNDELLAKVLREPKNETRHSAGEAADATPLAQRGRVPEISGAVRAQLGYA